MTERPGIAVIGGSGLYEMEGLTDIEEVRVETPFGDPSDAFITGTLGDERMVFLPRHGRGHRLLPHEINFRANLWGLKKLGVARVISVSAVGSMKEEIEPGHLVFVDQFIDRTRQRPTSFFGDGVVVHVPMADPVSPPLRQALQDAAEGAATFHRGGTYLCMEGPQFSTRAESFLYRSWGVSVIGMTNMPEAKLAREAEMAYATIALATDYDCWHEEEESVSVDSVLQILRANVEKAQAVIRNYVLGPREPLCPMSSRAVRSSLMTPKDRIPPERRRALAPILDPVLSDESPPV
ncbi:MAG TPA: S-methyl-5'-thioadenosine phosphorylase [Myxococcales bacterium LLY-WYZ-16_1]|jgi:5'-methylthioadenosine phosphorylase|nr:S-methyl-5'-thioadenosine phosphorylase [Myxococcales bacterium LLY-WYZ-16_1]